MYLAPERVNSLVFYWAHQFIYYLGETWQVYEVKWICSRTRMFFHLFQSNFVVLFGECFKAFLIWIFQISCSTSFFFFLFLLFTIINKVCSSNICSSWLLFVYMKVINFCMLVLYPPIFTLFIGFGIDSLGFFQDTVSSSIKRNSVTSSFSISVLPIACVVCIFFYLLSLSWWGVGFQPDSILSTPYGYTQPASLIYTACLAPESIWIHDPCRQSTALTSSEQLLLPR